MYGLYFFPLDAADSLDIPRAPGYLSVGQPRRVYVQTKDHLGQEDHLFLSS